MSHRRKRHPKDDLDLIDELFFKGVRGAPTALREGLFRLEVGQVVYDLRRRLRLSKAELARRVRTSARLIDSLEYGDCGTQTVDLLMRVAEAFDLQVKVGLKPINSDAPILEEGPPLLNTRFPRKH